MKHDTYPNSIYWKKLTANQTPKITTNFAALEEKAKEKLAARNYWYAAGGCSLGSTMVANREAFDEFRIVPRVLRESSTDDPDLSRIIFGQKIPAPIVMSPIGSQKVYHPEGEAATAKVFGQHHLPFTLSSYASCGFRSIKESNGEGNQRWFQLYTTDDDALTTSLMNEAKSHGFTTLVWTIDTWMIGWRPHDLDEAFLPFFELEGCGASVFAENEYCKKALGLEYESSEQATMEEQSKAAYYMLEHTSGIPPFWKKLEFLREIWGSDPIVVKGIQSVEDAKLAAQFGADGIIVSNHGGRQVDGAIGSLQALPGIVDAVGNQLTIGFDSGIRCGADIYKAIALGADFVLTGRPILWGLAIDGAEGVSHVLDSLIADLKLHLCLTGCKDLSDVTRKMLVSKDGRPLPV